MSNGAELLESLSNEQAAAVRSPPGATLVVAGAGTGKTRTLTARIAHLIGERGVDPSRIVAVSFTNKAAREIRDRVSAFLGDAGKGVRVGTFHAIAAGILKRWPHAAGYGRARGGKPQPARRCADPASRANSKHVQRRRRYRARRHLR